jgi:hypothetical protein
MGSPFHYLPLESYETVRVITVLPGDEDAEIECMIQHTSLETPKPYIALSYVWGDPTVKKCIRLNGRPFSIAKNLYAFLKQTRDALDDNGFRALFIKDGDQPMMFWVDAICINQEDLAERSQQVQCMKRIYEQSLHVIAWLGLADASSEVTFNKMVQLRTYYDATATALGYVGVNQVVMDSISRADEEIFGNADGPLDLAPWYSMREFFKRDWWERVWIIQESTTDVITSFMCGQRILSRATLDITTIIFLGLVQNPGFRELEKITGIEVALRLFNLRNHRHVGGSDMRLLEVLNFLRGYKATDLRDKVYAGLGLAVDYAPGDMRVDYSLSVADVYVELVRFLLKKSQTLDWLGSVGKSRHQLPELPSWAVDWSYHVARQEFHKYIEREDGSFQPIYSPIGSPPRLSGCTMPFIEGSNLLLQGIYVDRITSLKGPADHGINDTSTERTWAPADWQRSYVNTDERMLTAYFRTIVADVVTKNGKPVGRASDIQWPAELRSDDELSTVTAISSDGPGRSMSSMKSVTGRRCFATTERGYIGLVPSYAELGDEIWVLFGGQVLYVLRVVRKKYMFFGKTEYDFIGECYMHGLMDGEAMQPVMEGRAQLQRVVLR